MQTKQRDTISQLNLHSVHVFLAVHVFPHTVLLLLRYTEVHINSHYLECLDFKGSHQHCRNKHEYVYNVGRIIIIVIDIHLFLFLQLLPCLDYAEPHSSTCKITVVNACGPSSYLNQTCQRHTPFYCMGCPYASTPSIILRVTCSYMLKKFSSVMRSGE